MLNVGGFNLERAVEVDPQFMEMEYPFEWAGAYELPSALKTGGEAGGVGWLPTLIGTIVSFVVAYASVAWLLRYVAGHTIRIFVWYRWALAAAIIIALSTGALAATREAARAEAEPWLPPLPGPLLAGRSRAC